MSAGLCQADLRAEAGAILQRPLCSRDRAFELWPRATATAAEPSAQVLASKQHECPRPHRIVAWAFCPAYATGQFLGGLRVGAGLRITVAGTGRDRVSLWRPDACARRAYRFVRRDGPNRRRRTSRRRRKIHPTPSMTPRSGHASSWAGAVNAAHYQQMLPPNGADDW